ncbi:MAG: VPLPA-CTERM sorting domain-containing protein [Pseudomonadota bacterium]
MKTMAFTALLALGMAAGAATASSVQLDYQNSGPFGGDGTGEVVSIASPGYTGLVRAGGFHMTDNGVIGDFIAFCVDLSQYLGNSVTYTMGSTLFANGVQSDIARLYSVAGDQVGDKLGSAAFQVALWEIVTDYNASSVYDLDSGDFLTPQNGTGTEYNSNVETLAEAFLTDLSNGDPSEFRLTFFQSDTNQDLVTASPVPLPASALFLGGGLAVFAGLRRRRKTA